MGITKDTFMWDSLKKIGEMPEETVMQFGRKMMAYQILNVIMMVLNSSKA